MEALISVLIMEALISVLIVEALISVLLTMYYYQWFYMSAHGACGG